MAHARRTRPVDLVLVVLLNLLSRVAEYLAFLCLLCYLRLGKSLIEHVLIVLDDGRVASELVIESILCVRQNVSLVAQCRSVRLVSVRKYGHVILAQVGIESALSVGWSVSCSKTSGAIGNVRITSTAIVHVDNGLRVDVCEVMLRALLQECESAYSKQNTYKSSKLNTSSSIVSKQKRRLTYFYLKAICDC